LSPIISMTTVCSRRRLRAQNRLLCRSWHAREARAAARDIAAGEPPEGAPPEPEL
jgi:hypothetical protein